MRFRPRYIARYREIAGVFARLGFGAVLTQLGIDRTLDIPRRLFRQSDGAIESIPPAVRLRLALEELGPTFIKLGQIASTRPEILPPAVIHELSQLQDNVPPAPWEEVQPIIEAELGRPIHEVFLAFDRTPMAAASLAQVYPALLPDRSQVVVKVQRPNVDRIVSTDLEIIQDVAKLAKERIPGFWPFDPVDVTDQFGSALREELDYRREGRNADRFRENFKDDDFLYVPKVYWEYTTNRLMVQERIHGVKIDDYAALDAAGYDRNQIATHASSMVVKEVLEDGFFHADPHPGNMLIMPNEVIGLLDYGTVGYLDERDKSNLIRLYIAVIQFDSVAIVEQLVRMGVAESTVDERGLERDLRQLLRRYMGLPLKDISASELLSEVQPIIYEYRLHVPADYWLLIKTLVIMEGVGKQLAPEFDVFKESAPYVRRFLIKLALPTTWGPEVVRSITGWTSFLNDVPRQTNRLLSQLENGKIQINIVDPATESLAKQVSRAANRLIQAILIGSLTIGLALLLPSINLDWPWSALTWLLVVALFVVLILGFWLLWSIWRSGRQK